MSCIIFRDIETRDNWIKRLYQFDRKITALKSHQLIASIAVRSCDLAGSERVKKTKAEGERLQEAQSINSSLLELGLVSEKL